MSGFDERVRFYLRHRQQIEEWAALRSEATSAIDAWLGEMGSDVADLDLGADVELQVVRADEQAYPAFRFTRTTWGRAPHVLSVGLEWQRGKTVLSDASAPYVGVRAPQSEPIGVALRAHEALTETRSRRRDRASIWWPAYCYVPAPIAFPEGADEYRQSLLAQLRSVWDAYAPLIDLVVAAQAGR